MELREGDVFHHRYTIERFIGRGAAKIVWKAYDLVLQRVVALKILAPQKSEELGRYPPDFEHHMLREARMLAALNKEEGIVQIYDANLDEKTSHFYIAEELINGITLEDYLPSIKSTWPNAIIKKHVPLLFRPLGAMESHGIVHGDLTFQNILVTKDLFKITDFGQSVLASQETSVSSLRYQSPEHVRKEPLTHASDVWQAGVILYRMFTGEFPFEINSERYAAASGLKRELMREHLKKQILTSTPRPPSSFYYGPYLNELIMRCLEKDPVDRLRKIPLRPGDV
ncbi:serine/threonine protein kinase [Candidatus Woesearchaeota archaeon]|nr:serine/threonine protein kinase [Candidatus Woesearchaeota archaeon]